MITPEERDYIGEVIAEDAALRDGRVEGVTAELVPSAEESINGWKLVPVEPTEEMLNVLHDRVLILLNTRKREANILNDKAWWAAVVDAAPAPPAGGEVEVLAWTTGGPDPVFPEKIIHHLWDRKQDAEQHLKATGYAEGWSVQELVDRAHVTRLTAKKARLQAELTKALELIKRASLSETISPNCPLGKALAEFLAHQSAPAAKDGE